MFEGFQDRLLSYVLGIGFVTQNGKCGRVHAPFVGSNQLVEKLMLAVADAPDQHFFVEPIGWILQ